MIQNGLLPPQATELEEVVLGAVMLERDAINTVIEILTPQSFYNEKHGRIFGAVLELRKRNEPIDILTVTQELLKTNQLNLIGAWYITELTDRVASASNIEFHARIIQQKYIQRELIRQSSVIINKAYQDDADVFDLLGEVESGLTAIKSGIQVGKTESTKDIVDRTIKAIEEAKNNQGILGPSIGLKALDEILMGLRLATVYVIAGKAAMGKCFGKGTKILMYDGSLKNAEDVIVGDKLMGVDSSPRNVLSLARGKEMMYWVRQSKGIDYRVNESHILSLKASGTQGKRVHGKISNISVSDLLKIKESERSRYKGYKVEIDFTEKKLLLEPYFIGLWLGDGSTSKPEISNPDTEIEKYILEYAKKIGLQVTKFFSSNGCPSLSITKGYYGSQAEYSVAGELRKIGILGSKYIPSDYLINSKENRLQLLAGLLDTDGYYDKAAHGYEITQKNKLLAEQIKFLADTLGFKTSFNSKIATIKDRNFSCEVYRVRIHGNVEIIPVKVERRKPRHSPCTRDWKVTGIKIEQDVFDDYYGFEIDGDKLFLLEDCTVTHNSAMMNNIAKSLALKHNLRVGVFSLEMPSVQLVRRLLSDLAEIDNRTLASGILTPAQSTRLNNIRGLIDERFVIDDTPAITIQYLESKIKKLSAEGVKYFIIDYLQLMTLTPADAKGKLEEAQISFITRNIKKIAKKYDVCIIELAQLNRGDKTRSNHRPVISDLKGSSAIEQDADVIIMIHRPEYYNEMEINGKSTKGMAEMIIVKHRDGATDSVLVKYIGWLTRFEDLEEVNNNIQEQTQVF